jgi:hypothetical protein
MDATPDPRIAHLAAFVESLSPKERSHWLEHRLDEADRIEVTRLLLERDNVAEELDAGSPRSTVEGQAFFMGQVHRIFDPAVEGSVELLDEKEQFYEAPESPRREGWVRGPDVEADYEGTETELHD